MAWVAKSMVSDELMFKLRFAMTRLEVASRSTLHTTTQLEELDSALLALEGIRQEIRESLGG